MINKDRLSQYQQEIQAIQDSLTFAEYKRVIKAKILDFLSKETLPGDDLKEIEKQIYKLFHPDLNEFVKRVFAEHQNTIDLINELYDDIGPEISIQSAKMRAIQATNANQIGEYETKTVKAISKIIKSGTLEAKSFKEIAADLRKLDGKIQFYAETVAKTQTKGISRFAKSEKARIGEVFFYEYVGIIRPTTRKFCRIMVNTTHHINDILQMQNGNLGPVIQYCGGFNCHHDWEPDPFANKSTPGNWQEIEIGQQSFRILSPDDINTIFNPPDNND